MKIISSVSPYDFMDLLLDAICVVDREGYFLFISAASEHIFGYTPEEMIGKASIDFVLPADRERTLQTVGEILNGKLIPYFEIVICARMARSPISCSLPAGRSHNRSGWR